MTRKIRKPMFPPLFVNPYAPTVPRIKCPSCGELVEAEFDEYWNEYKPFFEDAEGREYCDQCFHDLYTVHEEKAIDNYHHKDKRVRQRAKATLERLEKIWGRF